MTTGVMGGKALPVVLGAVLAVAALTTVRCVMPHITEMPHIHVVKRLES